MFSQWGEIADVNLARDKDTGKPKGFAFIAYEDQRSTVLAVDNFNGITVRGPGTTRACHAYASACSCASARSAWTTARTTSRQSPTTPKRLGYAPVRGDIGVGWGIFTQH